MWNRLGNIGLLGYGVSMSYAHVQTACISGGRVVPVMVEVDIQPGLPVFSIIGLPDKGLEEARQRVRSAVRNSGFPFPMGRVTVNLSPSSLRKQGSSFDLAVALGILVASRVIAKIPDEFWVLGELGLEGEVRPVAHLTALLIEASSRHRTCVIPDQEERAHILEVSVCAVNNLRQVVDMLKQGIQFEKSNVVETQTAEPFGYAIDHIRGQSAAKRALEISLAGGHNLFLIGPPGSGKSMLAKSAAQLLPSPSREEALEIMTLRSIAGLPASEVRPYREPHYALSAAALLGGASTNKPGELALAHNGILFLDEFPLLPRETLESLRQPMQDKVVRLHKKGVETSYPADCIIIAAQNYCPCGWQGVEEGKCHCTGRDLVKYRHSVSAPLLERFELFCEVPRVEVSEVLDGEGDWNGSAIAQRIKMARERQKLRGSRLNARLEPEKIRKDIVLAPELKDLLAQAADRFHLSVRSISAILKVARTIADLAGDEQVAMHHLQEALQYRKSYE